MRRVLLGLACSIGLAFLLSAAGCSKATSFYKKVLDAPDMSISTGGPDKSGLRKRVLLLPFLNQASISEKRMEEVTSLFHSLLEKDPHLVLEKTSEAIPTTMKMRSPKFGIIMDADAAKKAEEMAVNVLLTVVLNPSDMRLKRTGLWPFRKLKREVEISVIVNGLDLYNGTLFLSNIESEKLDFEMEDLEDEEFATPKKPEMPEMDDKTFTRVLSRIMERQASVVRDAMRNLPWTGRIVSADGSRIVVSAGKKSGVSQDRIFEVFGRGEKVRSAGGSIYLLGPKVGEVRVVEVMEEYAAVQPLTEAEYQAGQVIRAKGK
jgi:hypothetical protein